MLALHPSVNLKVKGPIFDAAIQCLHHPENGENLSDILRLSSAVLEEALLNPMLLLVLPARCVVVEPWLLPLTVTYHTSLGHESK